MTLKASLPTWKPPQRPKTSTLTIEVRARPAFPSGIRRAFRSGKIALSRGRSRDQSDVRSRSPNDDPWPAFPLPGPPSGEPELLVSRSPARRHCRPLVRRRYRAPVRFAAPSTSEATEKFSVAARSRTADSPGTGGAATVMGCHCCVSGEAGQADVSQPSVNPFSTRLELASSA